MASPKKQVARLERIKLETVVALREHGFEGSSFAHPNVLLARIARHAFNSALREQIINKALGVQSTAPQISRVDFVGKIFGRQIETEIDNLSNVWRVTFRTRYLGERNGRVGVVRTKSLLVSDRTIRPAPPSRALRQC